MKIDLLERIAAALETIANKGQLVAPPHDYVNGTTFNVASTATSEATLTPPRAMRLEAVHITHNHDAEHLEIVFASVGTIYLADCVRVPRQGLSLHGRFLEVHPALGFRCQVENHGAAQMQVNLKVFWKNLSPDLYPSDYPRW